MKIYFSGTITKSEDAKNRYRKIIKALEINDNKVYNNGSVKQSPDDLLIGQSEKSLHDKYLELNNYMKNCDAFVADLSEPNAGIGYEVGNAIYLKKPVLILNYEKSDFQPMASIKGVTSKSVFYKNYNLTNISKIIQDFLIKSKKMLDTKFILIISSEIDRYLEWASKSKRMHKSQIVRKALEKIMREDKVYSGNID